MASAAPARSSIDLPPSDPNHRAIPRLKNAWSQVVRGDCEVKLTPSTSDAPAAQPQQPQKHQKQHQEERQHQEHLAADAADSRANSVFSPSPADSSARIGSSPATTPSPTPPSSSSSSSTCSPHVTFPASEPPRDSEATITAPVDRTLTGATLHDVGGNTAAKDLNGSSSTDGVDTAAKDAAYESGSVKAPKPAWKKPPASIGDSLDPGPIMGAVSWPALSDARSSAKSAAGNANEGPVLQKQAGKQGHMVNGVLPSHGDALQIPIPSSSAFGQDHEQVEQPAKVTTDIRGGGSPANTENGRGVHLKGDGPAHISSNAGIRRNFLRDHGRGNYGWHSPGRGYAYGRDNNMQLQHQRVGPRNMQRLPVPPFMGPNPGFMHIGGYQSGMLYIPVPPPDVMYGAANFGPPVVPMQGDLEHKLLRQIEYYFSFDNLLKDLYLRSHMDDQGFVSIAVIASFNRVQSLSQNHAFILEVLRNSAVVEVQGDRVRARDIWQRWAPEAGQERVVRSSPSSQLGNGQEAPRPFVSMENTKASAQAEGRAGWLPDGAGSEIRQGCSVNSSSDNLEIQSAAVSCSSAEPYHSHNAAAMSMHLNDNLNEDIHPSLNKLSLLGTCNRADELESLSMLAKAEQLVHEQPSTQIDTCDQTYEELEGSLMLAKPQQVMHMQSSTHKDPIGSVSSHREQGCSD